MNYLKYNIGPEANEFVKNRLQSGNTLSRLISGSLKNHEFVVYLPLKIESSQLFRFNEGFDSHTRNTSKKTVQITRYDKKIINIIATFIKNKFNNICILENIYARADDQPFQQASSRVRTYNQEVYHTLCGPVSDDEIRKEMLNADTGLRLFGILTEDNSKNCINASRKISEVDIQYFINKARHMFLLAYDGEAYIYWKLK